MTMYTQNISNTNAVQHAELAFNPTSEAGFGRPVRQIAQDNSAAWLPNPVVHRLMDSASNVQHTIATQLASSSSSVGQFAIALEVLQGRHYQSASSSVVRLNVTGRGLGGAGSSNPHSSANLAMQELRTEVNKARAYLSSYQTTLNKVQKKYDKASSSASRTKYMGKLRELEGDIRNARANLATAESNLSRALG